MNYTTYISSGLTLTPKSIYDIFDHNLKTFIIPLLHKMIHELEHRVIPAKTQNGTEQMYLRYTEDELH